ncbi:MAG: thioredoxin family protein [Acetobacter sp.]|nr:thioredoxin family protein [Acetobacter sp.]
MLKKIFIYLLVFASLITNAAAISFSQQTDLVSVTAIPEYKTISEETAAVTFITEVNIPKGWHLYWDNPGDTGDPTTLTFFESPYYVEKSSIHSAPKKSVFEEIITSYIYTQKLYFKTTFELKKLQNVTRLPFNLVLSYTACSESCFPETINLNFALPIGNIEEKNPTYVKSLLEAENTFPLPLTANGAFDDNFLELDIGEHILKDCAEPEFVSRHPKKSVLADLPETSVIEQGKLHIDFKDDELPPDYKGVLLCPGHAYYVEPKENSIAFPMQHSPNGGLFYYLLTAFIAGLILNLMPCVLPILGLKALYLVQNKQHTSTLSAIMYMLGVVCSFAVLSGILFYLRQKGTELGWGFQLQSPTFNIILLLLFFIIFLNLTDKLPLPDRCANVLSKIAGNKSFLTGFFAVIIACPCTGPFMGAALGYAITQPTTIYFGIFIALAIGYALPYTLIELFPNFFLRFIPKPGRWMITLKHILAMPIALTCLWLGWVIFNQLKPTATAEDIQWEVYTPAKIEQALRKNDAVFIDFTAKWCLVCLLNEKTTLSTEVFKQTVEKNRIHLFKADWTNRDENIREALKMYGRNSIPLYVYYPAGKKEPIILPQILTEDIIREKLSQ